MQLWVGLGNPGARYAGNRHNIGFMVLDRIAADHGFSPWRARFQGMAAEGVIAGEKLALLKPGTFMNLSGQSVSEALRFYKLEPANMVVFHDELDLAPGKIKGKTGGGHAGHNGLRSIHDHVGEAYGRIRLGIGHPGHKDAVADYVLQDFAKTDAGWIGDLLTGISEGGPQLAGGDMARFLNAVAQHLAPPKLARPKPDAGLKAILARASEPAPEGGAPENGASEDDAPEDGVPKDKPPLQRLMDRFR